jgi:hypothetical protein
MTRTAVARRLRRGGCLVFVVLGLVVGAISAVPNPPTPAGFRSGGLGLTRAEWRRQYTVAEEPFRPPLTEPLYEDAQHVLYSVDFWPEGLFSGGEARITAINPFGWLTSRETAQSLSRKLLPGDAQLAGTALDPSTPGESVDIYLSRTLATRYPPRLFTRDPWSGARPGTIYVFSGHFLSITIPSGSRLEARPSLTPP